MKKKLGIIQILAILIVGIIVGAFAERSHVFGYADNTPIIPSGTYKTSNTTNWKTVKISRTTFKNGQGSVGTIVDNRYTNRTRGRLVIASQKSNRSWSYYIAEIKEGWRISPIVNGKPSRDSSFIVYAN